MINVLAQLEVIHIRILMALEESNPPAEAGVRVADAFDLSPGLAEALCADLLRLALVETPGMSFRGLHNTVRLAPLGREILGLLRRESPRG
jgi:hypothetical protein